MRCTVGLLWAISVTFLAGCSTERYEGGFETSDLRAQVLTPDGLPAVGARVWLVESNGDSAPATVLDSVWTDGSGQASFELGSDQWQPNLGLDAQSGEWMAIHPGGLVGSSVVTIILSKAVEVSAPADSFGASPRLFVPGSHFVSEPSLASGYAVLSLPKGAWNVAVAHASGIVKAPLVVDSAPVFLPGLNVPADTSHVGPEIRLDSFLIDGRVLYADNSFPSVATWARLPGISPYQEYEFIPSLVSVLDSGLLQMETRPKSSLSEGYDSSITQAASWITSGTFPDTGVIAFKFRFFNDPAWDTTLWRELSLSDSSGNGVRLTFPPRFAWSGNIDSIVRPEYMSSFSSKNFPSDSLKLVQNTTWYFSWTPDSMAIFTTSGRIATIRLSGQYRGLQLHLKVFSYAYTGSSSIQVERVRLYRSR